MCWLFAVTFFFIEVDYGILSSHKSHHHIFIALDHSQSRYTKWHCTQPSAKETTAKTVAESTRQGNSDFT